MSAETIHCCFNSKREALMLSSFLFKLKRQQKSFGLHLVFSFWFLVTSLSNGKKKSEKCTSILLLDLHRPYAYLDLTLKFVPMITLITTD